MAISLGDIFIFFRGDTKPVEQAMDSLESKAHSWAGSVGGVLQNAFSFFLGDMLTSGVNGLLSAFQNSTIGMNASLETTTLQFKTLMGSADLAQEHVAMLFEFAKTTPFETGPIIAASLKLQTFGGDALNTQENITRIGNAAAATSAPLEAMGFWTGRLYSAIQGGRPFGEASAELQNMAVLSEDTRSKMEDMQKAGADGADIWKVYTDALDGFNGAMAEQAQSWTGLTSTLMDTFSMTGAEVFRPFFELAKDGLSSLNDMMASAGFESFKASAIDAMQGAADTIRDLASSAIPMAISAWEQFGPAVMDALSIVQDVLGALGDAAMWAYEYGSSLISEYAGGISDGVGWVVDALSWVADTVSYWLEPHSPPKILPDIDKWGNELVKTYMSAWSDPTLYSSLQDFGGLVGDVISNMSDMGELGGASVPELLVGSRGAMADALDELNRVGSVSEGAFSRIRQAAGPAGQEVETLARQYVEVAMASKAANDAQQELLDTQGQVESAQAALLAAQQSGDAQGIGNAQRLIAESKARRAMAQQKAAQASKDAQASQAKIDQEKQAVAFQKEQLNLLRQIAQETAKANEASAAKTPKKPKETEAEREARLAKAAQDEYQFSLLSTQEKIDALKAKQAALNPGQAEYWRIAGQIKQLEGQAAREAEANAKKEEAAAKQTAQEQERLKQAQWDHAYAIADTAGKLQMMKDKLASLNPEQAEYYSTLTSIANLEKQLSKEQEAAAKKAAGAGGKKGGAGKKGGGGAKKGGGGGPPKTGGPPKRTPPKKPETRGELRGDDSTEDGTPNISRAAEALGNLGKSVRNVFAPLASLTPLIQQLGSSFSSMLSTLGGMLQTQTMPLIQKLMESFRSSLPTLIPIWNMLVETIQKLVPVLMAVATVIYGSMIASFNLWISILSGALPGAFALVQGVVAVFLGVLNVIIDTVVGLVSIVGAALRGDWAAVWTLAGTLVHNLVDDVNQVINGLVMTVVGLIGTLVGGVVGLFQYLYDVVVGHSIIPDMVNGVIQWITQMKDNAINFITAMVNGAIAVLNNLIAFFTTTLKSAVDGVVLLWTGTLQPAFQAVSDFVSGALTSSFNGLTGTVIPALEAIVSETAGVIKEAFMTAISEVSKFLSGTFTGAVNTARGVIDMIKRSFDYVSDAVESLIKWLDDLIEKWKSMKPPSWITGHSPPPLADWFSYVADATKDAHLALTDYDRGLRGTRPSMEGIGTVDGSKLGGWTVNGPLVGTAQIRSDEDITRLAREILTIAKRKARE